jgi:Sulfotransferase domain
MSLAVFSAGFGRTGTMSLKLALEELGFGPCHHMDEVLANGVTQVPLWNAAYAGRPDFEAIYRNYRAAVDWPTAAYWRELAIAYPDAKVILSTRSAESWCNSFSGTILTILLAPETWPEPARPWLEMVTDVVVKRSLGGKTGKEDLIAVFNAHEAAVKATISPERLLVFDVRQGWEPLCRFLGKPVPATPFPRTNSKEEFFELVQAGMPT